MKKHFSAVFFCRTNCGSSQLKAIWVFISGTLGKMWRGHTIDDSENRTAAQAALKDIMTQDFCSGGGDYNSHKPFMENS